MNHTTLYRRRINSLTIVASAAFAGGNLFIGLSIGAYWLSQDPLEFMHGFWAQFTTFLYTIMPLFMLTLGGLVLSAKLDWKAPRLRRLWLIALGLYIATTLVTAGIHMPENLRLRAATYTAEEAASARLYWLLWHIPRMVFTVAIPALAMRAVFDRQNDTNSSGKN